MTTGTVKIKRDRKRISNLKVLACGYILEGYPRDDTLWGGLSRSEVGQVIDLRKRRMYVYGSRNSGDNSNNRERKNIFVRIARKRRSLLFLARFVTIALQIPAKFIYAISTSWRAGREKVDIIFVFPRNRYLAIWLGLLKRLHGARVYVDLCESVYENAVAGARSRFILAKCWIEEYLCIRFADQLLCVTEEYAGYYRQLYNVKDDKLNVVPDGIQDVWLNKLVSTNHDSGRPGRVIYWGTLLTRKHGLDIVIDVAEELLGKKIEFILCGSGQQEAWLREQVRTRNLDNIVFKGYVPTDELIPLVDSADVTLGHLKDVQDERLAPSNKLRQGMARGKPVINIWTRQQELLYQTKENPVPPVVQIKPDAESLTKAIIGIIEDPKRAEKIGQAARATVENFHGVEAIALALRRSFEKALK